MKKIVADLEVIKKDSLESLGFSKETIIYAVCEKNAQVPIAFMTQISSFPGKFITLENEKKDVETAKSFLVGYLAGCSNAKDELILISENYAIIDEFKKLFPKISIKVCESLAVAAGKRKKAQTVKKTPAKAASSPVRTPAGKKTTAVSEKTAVASKKKTAPKADNKPEQKTAGADASADKPKTEAAVKTTATKKKRKTKAETGDYSELLEALKPIDREYPFEEKVENIYTALHDSLLEESLEMMLRLHVGKDWEYVLQLLKPHYKKLKRLAG